VSDYQITHDGYDDDLIRTLTARWRSGLHVGLAKPAVRAYCRTVKLRRRVERVDSDEVYAQIPGWEGSKKIWKGQWQGKTGWERLPNLQSYEINQDYDTNGVATATITIDNVHMAELNGVAGIYHAMQRGYFSPWRGYDPSNRPPVPGERNTWFNVLSDKSTQIIVLSGYGDAVVPVFDGLLNDINLVSRPDRIEIIARDGGQTLTDQHVFVNAKVRQVRDPITFYDRREAHKSEEVGYGAYDGGEHTVGHPARLAMDSDTETYWQSKGYATSTPDDMPFIEFGVSNGLYDANKLCPRFRGMTAYVAIRARDKNAPGGNGAKHHNGSGSFADGEWIDAGKGEVPHTNVPFVKMVANMKVKDQTVSFPDLGYDLGDDSRIRIYFTNLDRGRQDARHKARQFRAGVIEVKAIKRELKQEAKKANWILVDDLADVVKTVLQWAGLNAWEVESTGVRIKDPAVFNRGHFLIDIIKAAAEQVGYVFYIKPPTFFDEENLEAETLDSSLGIAVFRQASAMHQGTGRRDDLVQVREDQVLLGVQARLTDEPLAYNIRVRGKEVKKKKGGRALGADRTLRYMYVYRPPWTRESEYRNANIKKYVVHTDPKLRDLQDCKIAALFIAFRQALEAATCQFECPMLPTVFLDHQTAVVDEGTGLSTRVWVVQRTLTYQGGEAVSFKMSLTGSLLDLPDTRKVRKELVGALRDSGRNPGLSQWEEDNWGHVYRNGGRRERPVPLVAVT
jgi:hypothetical protein